MRMMGQIPRSVVSIAILAVSATLFSDAGRAGPSGADVVFTPHRAVYDLSLERSSPGSGVAQVIGRIVYELTGSACEGYAQSMRFLTQTVTQEGEGRMTDLRNS